MIQNSAINDLIAPFLANQIAGFTSDFKMNMISSIIAADPGLNMLEQLVFVNKTRYRRIKFNFASITNDITWSRDHSNS